MKMKSMNRFGTAGSNNLYSMHGCCGHGQHASYQDNNAMNNMSGTVYQCPMKCEGDKTYDHPGNCPVCNMVLQPVGEQHHHH